MRIAVTGSIATDHLMTFQGSFSDQLLADRLDKVSLSFLADQLEIRRGGVGANIAYGMAQLGLAPLLVGAVGTDFAEYDAWLRAAGVDTASVHRSSALHTARFVCTTDTAQNQIATMYSGAMAEARHIDLGATVRRAGGLDAVLIGADDPEAMLRHTSTAHWLGVSVAADPSQQLARLDREQTRHLVDGAWLLFTNEYEAGLLRERTGWSEREILDRVELWVVTLGAGGVSITGRGRHGTTVPAVPVRRIADPTGAGDAFRAGFLAGLAWQWPERQAAQLGCAVAAVVLEATGSQEYELVAADLAGRIEDAYGPAAAREVELRLAAAR